MISMIMVLASIIFLEVEEHILALLLFKSDVGALTQNWAHPRPHPLPIGRPSPASQGAYEGLVVHVSKRWPVSDEHIFPFPKT